MGIMVRYTFMLKNLYILKVLHKTHKRLFIIVGDGTVSIHNYGANPDEEHGWQSGEVIT